MSTRNQNLAFKFIRWAAAANMLIHGVTRLRLGTVGDFDGYLVSLGFPPYIAWALTFFEIGAAIAIIFGKWIAPLSIVFCIELAMGIVLVHFKEGWFVVGAGNNGMEYSVLLIICFASNAFAAISSNKS
jgi:putative oxidoreductase